MWFFNKKKVKQFEPEKLSEIPLDCIFNSIIDDLNNLDFRLWDFSIYTVSHPQIEYEFFIFSTGRVDLRGIYDGSIFTEKQQEIIKKKISEIETKQALNTKRKILSELFPQCFKK